MYSKALYIYVMPVACENYITSFKIFRYIYDLVKDRSRVDTS